MMLHFFIVGYVHKIISVQVFISQGTEYKVKHRGSRFNVRMLYNATRFEAGKDEFVYVFFQGHTVLHAHGNRYGKAVQETTHGSALFCHINKDLAQRTITILSGAEE